MTTVDTRPFQATGAWLAALPETRFFLILVGPLLAIYLLTASWTTVKSPDPLTNAIAAWTLGTKGTTVLVAHEGLEAFAGGPTWIVDSPKGPVSAYPPGAALLAAPLYAIWPGEAQLWTVDDPRRWEGAPVDELVPPLGPAALIAAVTTALAVGLAGLTARPFVGSVPALAGSYVYGLGTGAWAVAADTLWQHGPAMFWLALGIWLASREREWLGGLAFGMAILTRAPTAIVAASVGLALGWARRSVSPIFRIGMGAALGLFAVMAYNATVFGSAAVSGGYGDIYTTRVIDTNLLAYLRNISGGLFDPVRGLLALSPFIALAIVGLTRIWRRVPAALKGRSIGGTIYLLVQWKANRFSGGSQFVGYRYPLEAMAAVAPALMMGWEWILHHKLARLALIVTTTYAVAMYAYFTL